MDENDDKDNLWTDANMSTSQELEGQKKKKKNPILTGLQQPLPSCDACRLASQ